MRISVNREALLSLLELASAQEPGRRAGGMLAEELRTVWRALDAQAEGHTVSGREGGLAVEYEAIIRVRSHGAREAEILDELTRRTGDLGLSVDARVTDLVVQDTRVQDTGIRGKEENGHPTALAARALMDRIDNPVYLRTIENRGVSGGWAAARGTPTEPASSDAIAKAAVTAVLDLLRAWAAEAR